MPAKNDNINSNEQETNTWPRLYNVQMHHKIVPVGYVNNQSTGSNTNREWCCWLTGFNSYWIQPNPRENYSRVHEWKINAWFSIDMTMGGNSIHTGLFGRRVNSEESAFFLYEVKCWNVITTRDLCRNNEEKSAWNNNRVGAKQIR